MDLKLYLEGWMEDFKKDPYHFSMALISGIIFVLILMK